MPTLMVSVSGIRGIVGDGLDPEVIIKYVSAFAKFSKGGKIVVGRDARISGDMVMSLVAGALQAAGADVIDIGIVPTPTVQFTVKTLKAAGGIALTASHNPNQWNALKLLNATGQFLTPEENVEVQKILAEKKPEYVSWDKLGKRSFFAEGLKNHISSVLNLKYIDVEAIKKRKFKVLADCVNGAGSYCIPDFLKQLGCQVIELDCEKTGIFPRLPEPIPENLTATMEAVKKSNADIGIVVDPDVDRLVLITEKGEHLVKKIQLLRLSNLFYQKKKAV